MKKLFYLFTIFVIIFNINIIYARDYMLNDNNLESIDGSNIKTWIGWKMLHFGATTPISKKNDPVYFKSPMIQGGQFIGYNEGTYTVKGYGHYGLSFSKQLLGLLAYIKNNSNLDYDTTYIPIYDQPEFDSQGNLIMPTAVKLKDGIDITIGKMIRTWYSEDYEDNEFKDFWTKSFTDNHYSELKNIQNKFYWHAYGESAYNKLSGLIGSLTPKEQEVLKGVVLSFMEARYRNKDVNGKMQLQIKAAEGDISPFLVSLENLSSIVREGSAGNYTYRDVNNGPTYQWPKLENGKIDFDKIIDNAYLWMIYYEKDSLKETTHTTLTSKLSESVEEDVDVDWEAEYWDLTGFAITPLTGKALEEFYSRCQQVRSLFKKSKENTEGIFGSEEIYDITSDINFSEAISDMKSAMQTLASGAGSDVSAIFSGLDSDHIARTYIMAKNIVETNRIQNEYAYYDIGLNIITYTPGLDTGEIMLMDFQKIKLKEPLTVKIGNTKYKTYEDTDNDGIYDREELGDETSESDSETTLKKKIDVSGFIRKAVEKELYGNNDSDIRANKEYIDEIVAKVKYNIYNQRNKFDSENIDNNKQNWKEVYENNLNVDNDTRVALNVLPNDTAKVQYLKLSPSKLEVELWKYKSNPTLKDTDFDGIDDGLGKAKLREIERTYGLTDEIADDIKEREKHCKMIPSSVLKTLKKDKVPKDNHFTGRMNSSRLSGSNGIEVDMNMDYRYFFLSNKLYYDELSTMSLLYANSIYRKGDNQTIHSGLQLRSANNFVNVNESFTINGVQSMNISKFKNLPVKEMMEHFGFKNVRTYYMGEEMDKNAQGYNADDDPADGADYCRNYKDTHKSKVAIGYRPIEYHGIYKTVIGVVIRGTAEDDDRDSNFDMGDKDLKEKLNYNGGKENYDTTYQRIRDDLNTGVLDKCDSQYSTELLHFAGGYPDWTHTQHHAGFDIVANRIFEVLNDYYKEFSGNFSADIETYDENTIETAITANSVSNYSNDVVDGGVCFWITGHSMGAGVANLVATNLIDKGHRDNVYCYTFAAPNTFYRTDNREDNYKEPHGVNYRCIFNIVNDDDFVPKLPMEQCEWTKYGRTATASFNILKGYKTIRVVPDEHLSNNERFKFVKYNGNSDACNDVINAFVKVYESNKKNMRNDTYRIEDLIKSKFATNAGYQYRNRYVKPFQNTKSFGSSNTIEYVFEQKQSPAYFLNILSGSMHSQNNTGITVPFLNVTKWLNKGNLLFYELHKRYNDARLELVKNRSILETPHYLESYYNMTKTIKINDFK